MRTLNSCKTAAGLLAALAVIAMPSFAADKMAGKMAGKPPKMAGSKMAGKKMAPKKMDKKADKKGDAAGGADAGIWKKAVQSVGNADRSTLGKMSPAEKEVVIKLLKKK